MLSGRGVVSKPSVSAVIQEGVNLSCGLHCRLGMNGSNSCSLHSGILRFRQYPFPSHGKSSVGACESWRGRSASGLRAMLVSWWNPLEVQF